MTSGHKAILAATTALSAQAATLLAAAFTLPGWPLGVVAVLCCTGAALYWYGHHVGYRRAYHASFEDETRAVYQWYASGQ